MTGFASRRPSRRPSRSSSSGACRTHRASSRRSASRRVRPGRSNPRRGGPRTAGSPSSPSRRTGARRRSGRSPPRRTRVRGSRRVNWACRTSRRRREPWQVNPASFRWLRVAEGRAAPFGAAGDRGRGGHVAGGFVGQAGSPKSVNRRARRAGHHRVTGVTTRADHRRGWAGQPAVSHESIRHFGQRTDRPNRTAAGNLPPSFKRQTLRTEMPRVAASSSAVRQAASTAGGMVGVAVTGNPHRR